MFNGKFGEIVSDTMHCDELHRIEFVPAINKYGGQ
jgi:hypothetical protein